MPLTRNLEKLQHELEILAADTTFDEILQLQLELPEWMSGNPKALAKEAKHWRAFEKKNCSKNVRYIEY